MRVLALDLGSKTIGLARGDTDHGVATPWETLRRRGNIADLAQIVSLVEREQAAGVVVGLPLELDGRRGHRARLAERFVLALRRALRLPTKVWTWDERFTTAAAERSLLAADVSRAKRKLVIDAVAAQQILQSWLDAAPQVREALSTPNSPPALDDRVGTSLDAHATGAGVTPE